MVRVGKKWREWRKWRDEIKSMANQLPEREDTLKVHEWLSVEENSLAFTLLCVGLLTEDKERFRLQLQQLGRPIGRDAATVNADLALVPFAEE